MSLEKLLIEAKTFTLPEKQAEISEYGRLEFIKKFPLESLPNLSLEQYSQGTNKESFCYWLEFKKILFGIGGGSAAKFGIYKSDDGYFYSGSAKNKKKLELKEAEEIFASIKKSVLTALEYIKSDNIENIREINSPLWNIILLKILTIYYPEKFLSIGSSEVLITCAHDLKPENVELHPNNLIKINYECRKKLRTLNEFKDWEFEKLSTFIWHHYLDESKRDYYIIGSKYGDEDIFAQMLEESKIAIGFASHIDLTNYQQLNHSKIISFLEEQGEESKSFSALKYFMNLKKGDRIAIKSDGSPKGKQGFLAIVGIAEVCEKDGKIYEYNPNGLYHCINVNFLYAPVYKEFPLGGYGKTIHKLSKPEHIDSIFNAEYATIEKKLENNKQEEQEKEQNHTSFNHPLNVILYGPPGTGKTYNTILKAAEIVSKKNIEAFKEAKEIFNNHLEDRIQFITFHQNYSYEDFIQGLRPDVENESLRFQRKDGIFTKMAINALFEYYKVLKKKNSKSITVKKNVDENEIFLDFVNYLKNLENKDFNTSTGSTIFIDEFTKNDNINFKHQNSVRTYTVSGKRLLKLFSSFNDIKKIKSLHNDIRDAIGGCNTTVYWVALREFISFFNNYQKETTETEPEEESYDDIKYENKKKLLSTVDLKDLRSIETSEVPNYVLIIDEINRANISRVFGELISLIEPDKRSHGDIPLSSMLPSSEEQFIVPSNLYIIGTMNTADKSIALLDIALRRRFEFEAMYPLYEIDGHEIYDSGILEKINKKIKDLKGNDFQIGHAYFMGNGISLQDRMNKKVIPLLLEYFMNDEKEVKGILKDAGLEINQESYCLQINGLP